MLDLVVLSRNTVVLEAVNSMVVILEVADLALVSLEIVVSEAMMQQ